MRAAEYSAGMQRFYYLLFPLFLSRSLSAEAASPKGRRRKNAIGKAEEGTVGLVT